MPDAFAERYACVCGDSVAGSVSSIGPEKRAMCAPPASASGKFVPDARPTVPGVGKNRAATWPLVS